MFRLFLTFLLSSFLLLPNPISACAHHLPRSKRQMTPYPEFTIGTDGPADTGTLGFMVGHIALLVNDLAATQYFYGNVLGMRHIFTFNGSEDYSIMYMGHSSGGKNGTGFQTGADLFAEIYNIQGLMEFIEFKNSSNPRAYTTGPMASFSHFGLVVPDITLAEQRMDAYNVTILKRVGQSVDEDGEIPMAWGMPGPGPDTEAALTGLVDIGFDGYMVIADPDGNIIEVLQQD